MKNMAVLIILLFLFVLATTVGGFIIHPIIGIIVLLFWAIKYWSANEEWKDFYR